MDNTERAFLIGMAGARWGFARVFTLLTIAWIVGILGWCMIFASGSAKTWSPDIPDTSWANDVVCDTPGIMHCHLRDK